MSSKPIAFLLADLGVTKTHSRPHVSDDNPYSESQFRTMKYRPDFPDRFGCIQDSRAFCQRFFRWYNEEHRHSGLGCSFLALGQTEVALSPQYTPPDETLRLIMPGDNGGCEWNPAAYSPRTKFVYYGARHDPDVFETHSGNTSLISQPVNGDLHLGSTFINHVPGAKPFGLYGATDTRTGKVIWKPVIAEFLAQDPQARATVIRCARTDAGSNVQEAVGRVLSPWVCCRLRRPAGLILELRRSVRFSR
jgi:hypothetical protein